MDNITLPDGVYSLQHTCRTCLRSTHGQLMIPVFDTGGMDSSTMHIVQGLTMLNLTIGRDDGLPQQICSECMGHLSNICSFRRSCERAEYVLRKFFKLNSSEETKFLLPGESNDLLTTHWTEQLTASENESKIDQSYSTFEFLNIDSISYVTKDLAEERQILPANDDNSSETKLKIKDNQIDNPEIDVCKDEIFSDFEDFENDESDKEKESDAETNLECNICNKTYKRKINLKRHLKSHSKQVGKPKREHKTSGEKLKKFKCENCSRRFVNLESLDLHLSHKDCNSDEIHQCRFCEETFSSTDELDSHTDDHHPPDRPYSCSVCTKTFQSVSNRNTHLQSHNKEDSYKCDTCGSGFRSKLYLRKHQKSVHTIANHECPHCFAKFDNTVRYEYHLKSHDPNKKYKCKFCEKSFMQQHHLANHERTHTGVKPFLCSTCGKDFKQECNFKLHLRIHNGVRPYICSVCGKDFIQRGSFVMHMRLHSGVRPYQCEHCGKDFVQKSSLTVHLRTHTGERPYKCDSCDKAFAQAQQMKYHRHSAHGAPATISKRQAPPKPSSDGKVYPYCCPICNKGFKVPSSLTTHMKIHNEHRKHICTQCGNSFKRAEHLRIHINGVHLKQKPYKCEMCNKTFAQSGDRNIHMLRHTGEKPHQCTYCKKHFRLLKAMRAHMRIHTGEKPYSCEFCKMEFMTYTSLATHIMKHEIENRKRLAVTVNKTSENLSLETSVPVDSTIALSSITVTSPP